MKRSGAPGGKVRGYPVGAGAYAARTLVSATSLKGDDETKDLLHLADSGPWY